MGEKRTRRETKTGEGEGGRGREGWKGGGRGGRPRMSAGEEKRERGGG